MNLTGGIGRDSADGVHKAGGVGACRVLGVVVA